MPGRERDTISFKVTAHKPNFSCEFNYELRYTVLSKAKKLFVG